MGGHIRPQVRTGGTSMIIATFGFSVLAVMPLVCAVIGGW